MYEYAYRKEANQEYDTEYYQLSEGVYIECNKDLRQISKFTLYGEDIDMDKLYKVAMRNYDYMNCKEFFNIEKDEILKNNQKRIICTSSTEALYEYLQSSEPLPKYPDVSRIVFK